MEQSIEHRYWKMHLNTTYIKVKMDFFELSD